jgi:transcription elongation factor Elf1
MRYSKADCIESLQAAKEELGKSPSMQQYNDLGLSPSADTIVRRFGSWNAAKKESGLIQNQQNNQVQEKPNGLELPEDKKWENLTPYQRYYYKNREKEKQRTKKRTEKLKTWFKDYKKNFECEECGEEHHACLDFHHIGEKEIGVAELVTRRNTSKERIKEEVKKCKVLCANCHRKKHAD